jgi:hypothetical protein
LIAFLYVGSKTWRRARASARASCPSHFAIESFPSPAELMIRCSKFIDEEIHAMMLSQQQQQQQSPQAKNNAKHNTACPLFVLALL